MSIVTWDGLYLVSDRRACSGDLHFIATKTAVWEGEILAWVGDHERGLWLAQWYRDGADPAKWPTWQGDKDHWTRLIVASAKGAWEYEMLPVRQRVEGDFRAWGSGRDFAMGAFALCADAKRAAEVACLLCPTCGGGLDVHKLT